MKKMFAYKTIDQIEDVLDRGEERSQRYRMALERIARKVIYFPVSVHCEVIRLRLKLTDKYLEGKAKTCEAVLKKISHERKKVAKEQTEARKMLKDLRGRYVY